ncbi:ATP-binding protein [Peribacillus sp. ACCC06369]|uniref:ATP-binding protein n=1 Tax=Peribacillus sp. ACCC06369 TaxID=3055860 RepID=UPI0025A1A190|nr:ATP-binding protein [Peribacillus sp. ACCC06369]MDM5357787.1 ATP-binding protein [Peribacillus sp. ACCC06369]
MKYIGRIIVPVLFFILILPYLGWLGHEERRFSAFAAIYLITILSIAWCLGAIYDNKRKTIALLQDSEGRYRIFSKYSKELVNSFNEVIFQTDDKGKWLYLNPAWKSMSGATVNESLGLHFSKYMDNTSYQDVLRVFAESFHRGNKYFRADIKLNAKKGTSWVEAFVKLIYDDAGKFIGTAGIISEINERKHAEEKLVSLNEHLAITSSKLSTAAQLAAGIAHEVRNPMTAIMGFVKLIKDGGADKQEYYDIIFSEINRIEQVLNELLLLSKPAEAVFLEKDLKESCNHVITLLETNAVLNNIQIHKNYDTEPIFIYFDENQIKQVLINMIKNSIESMPDGGNIFVSIYEKYGEVFVSILDEGEGIPENSLQKVGEPFFTTKSSGTGLGLSVCFKIIEKHGGKVFITSELKKGTKIVCVFPIVQPKEHRGNENVQGLKRHEKKI